jgi:hypothetical protein
LNSQVQRQIDFFDGVAYQPPNDRAQRAKDGYLVTPTFRRREAQSARIAANPDCALLDNEKAHRIQYIQSARYGRERAAFLQSQQSETKAEDIPLVDMGDDFEGFDLGEDEQEASPEKDDQDAHGVHMANDFEGFEEYAHEVDPEEGIRVVTLPATVLPSATPDVQRVLRKYLATIRLVWSVL